jgi:hypothetical protein
LKFCRREGRRTAAISGPPSRTSRDVCFCAAN